MLPSRDVLLAENKFETDMNSYNKENYEFFIDNVYFDLPYDTEDTELTHDNVAVPDGDFDT